MFFMQELWHRELEFLWECAATICLIVLNAEAGDITAVVVMATRSPPLGGQDERMRSPPDPALLEMKAAGAGLGWAVTLDN